MSMMTLIPPTSQHLVELLLIVFCVSKEPPFNIIQLLLHMKIAISLLGMSKESLDVIVAQLELLVLEGIVLVCPGGYRNHRDYGDRGGNGQGDHF